MNLSQSPQKLDSFIQSLETELTLKQIENQVIMTTSLVSTIILMYRKGINTDLLLKRIQWLYIELKERGADTCMGMMPTKKILLKSLSYLTDFTTVKRDVIEPKVEGSNGEKNLLMLAYYRNNLSHIFVQEAMIVLTILSHKAANLD
jgi:glycerol-3-phosphate O-acyltransferase